ncbi:MAG: hypothetical protein QOG25_1758 [Acetobacteraceae bacterium]|nr:hypothetical protein [Acetobacteraceae bacterium]
MAGWTAASASPLRPCFVNALSGYDTLDLEQTAEFNRVNFPQVAGRLFPKRRNPSPPIHQEQNMRRPGSVRGLEVLGRVRLSASFFMRDFLHSEIADFHGIPNLPDHPDLAIAAGRKLCDELLEPLQATFGRLAIRSAYRAPAVNAFGNEHGLNCASNERNRGRHIWDQRDRDGNMGAMATVVLPWFADWSAEGGDWRAMAWWIHDQLPYSQLQFFPRLGAFNIGWRENPVRRIDSFVAPRGCLTRAGLPNWTGDHALEYAALLVRRDRR